MKIFNLKKNKNAQKLFWLNNSWAQVMNMLILRSIFLSKEKDLNELILFVNKNKVYILFILIIEIINKKVKDN
jgi:hypothetical protein